MIFFLLLIGASFHPATPTVGDLITIEFDGPVILDRSDAYEVVTIENRRAVVRTFRPEPFEISGTVGGVAFHKLKIPVQSVLGPDDNMQPAALKPPIRPPASDTPVQAIGWAAAATALAWAAVFLLQRRLSARERLPPELPEVEIFRQAVAGLRGRPSLPHRWAALADATRRYLSSIEPSLGAELTTSELLRRLRQTNIRPQEVVATILRQGDLEKFSPWGARPSDFDSVAAEALELIPAAPIEEAA